MRGSQKSAGAGGPVAAAEVDPSATGDVSSPVEFPEIPVPAWYRKRGGDYAWRFAEKTNLTESEVWAAYAAALREQNRQMRIELERVYRRVDHAQAQVIIVDHERQFAQDRALRAVQAAREHGALLQVGEPPADARTLSSDRLRELVFWARREQGDCQRLVNESFRARVMHHAEAHIAARERWADLIGLLGNATALATSVERIAEAGGTAATEAADPDYALQREFEQDGFRIRVEREMRSYPLRRITASAGDFRHCETVNWIEWEGHCGGQLWIPGFIARAQRAKTQVPSGSGSS